MTQHRLGLGLALLITVMLLAACGATPTATPVPPTATPSTFSDAFAYCRAVGTIDAADARYSGPKVPDNVAAALRKAMKLPADTGDPNFAARTFWRCMDGQVYGCNVGANIPCSSKASTSQTPSQAMNEFCGANPAADVIPAVVTGRETVYSWRCTGGKPAIDKEVTKVDKQGYASNFWYELTP